jgi:hypothetical protein
MASFPPGHLLHTRPWLHSDVSVQGLPSGRSVNDVTIAATSVVRFVRSGIGEGAGARAGLGEVVFTLCQEKSTRIGEKGRNSS